MQKKEHEVNCKVCGVEVITTDLDAWKRHNETCFRCKHKKGLDSRKKQIRKPKEIDKEEILKEKFNKLLELRKEYFDFMYGIERNTGIMKELEDFFDVDLFEVFYDSSELKYTEFFNMGENGDSGLTWDDLVSMIKEYKKSQQE